LLPRGGFTVIELMVAVLLMVIVIGGVVVGVAGTRRASLSATASTLDSAVRYLYQLAAINGRPYRLVVDMESGAWWGEELDIDPEACATFVVADTTRPKLRIHTEREDDKRGRKPNSPLGAPAGKDGADEPTCAEEERDKDGNCPPQGFVTFKSNLLRKQELPKGIRFSGIMTTHQQDVQEGGTGYVYFFANGNVEKAYIFLATEADTYTVETFPLMGKARVHPSKLSLDRFRRDERG